MGRIFPSGLPSILPCSRPRARLAESGRGKPPLRDASTSARMVSRDLDAGYGTGGKPHNEMKSTRQSTFGIVSVVLPSIAHAHAGVCDGSHQAS
jgi:hypothetical protein